MNVTNSIPVTAGIEQTKVTRQDVTRTDAAQALDRQTQIPTAAELSLNNAESTERANNSPTNSTIAAEQIRVSVTTGQSNIRGNLSPVKAAEIYETISKLL